MYDLFIQLKHDAGRGCLTPLHVALERGYNEVAKILIEHNAPLNCQDWEGHTPLHYAAKSGKILTHTHSCTYTADYSDMIIPMNSMFGNNKQLPSHNNRPIQTGDELSCF